MVVLRAIGRFFARIGRWIRDTAWVQPLLIVGGIFGIIFSIPYITNWVKGWFAEGDAATAYYERNQIKWDGIEDGDSQVDKFFTYLQDPENHEAEAKKYGRKFFLNFVQKGCDGCNSNYEGYKVLQDKWNKNDEFKFESGKEESFKIFNIFIDKADKDGNEYFMDYISGDKSQCRYGDIFNDAASLVNHYMVNIKGGDSYYERLASNDNSFESPVTFLIDMDFEGDSGYELGQYGITEIFYTISGKKGSETGIGKARSLWDCWNHTGNFSAEADK